MTPSHPTMDSRNWPTHIVEDKASVDPAEDLFNPTVHTSGIDERRLMRRIDLRLLSTFILLYLLSFLDRSSIGKWVCAFYPPFERKSNLTHYLTVLGYVEWANKINLISSLQLYNLEDDLKMSDKQYLLALTVFFFSYAIFEVAGFISGTKMHPHSCYQVPSNIFLKRLRPSVWFSVLMCMWGLMMVGGSSSISRLEHIHI